MSMNVSKVAIDLFKKYVDKEFKIKAVIISHSHIDHFGGAGAFITQEQIDSGEVEFIVPYNFLEESISENILSGAVMNRRADYQSGTALDTN
jgi:alkyl sulfatase BDS1-like metallo-beta-lactamase superfamily hydrolase